MAGFVIGEFSRKGLASVEEYAIAFADENGSDPKVAILSLQTIESAFARFWLEHGQMMLQTGHMIPFIEGFRDYWAASFPNVPVPSPSAISVFRSPTSIEARLVRAVLHSNPNLELISWEQAATALLGNWRDFILPHTRTLSGLRVLDISGLDIVAFARETFQKPGRLYDPNQLRLMDTYLLSIALACALSRSGWQLQYSGPASELAFRCNGKALEPFRLVGGVFDGSTSETAWQATCLQNGVGDLSLS